MNFKLNCQFTTKNQHPPLIVLFLYILVFFLATIRVSGESTKKLPDPCDDSLGLLLQAENYRIKGQQTLALNMVEESRRANPDCVEGYLLYAEILLELGEKQLYFMERLRIFLTEASSKFPDQFEFPLMSLELCFFSNGNQTPCDVDPIFQKVEGIFSKRRDIPNWGLSSYRELLAEKFKSEGDTLSAARLYQSAWELSRENTFLLTESALMYAQFGMLRTSLHLFQKSHDMAESRTGYIDQLNLIRMLQKILILQGTQEAVEELVQNAPDDQTIMETASRLIQIGKQEVAGSLLSRISQSGKTQLSYLALKTEYSLWVHQYDSAVDITQNAVEYALKTKETPYHKYLESFLTACMLAGKEKHALSWYRNHAKLLDQVNGFPRILLSLMLYHTESDRTLWNRTFYSKKLTPPLENFRLQAEENGLDLTYSRLHLNKYLQYEDNQKVFALCKDMLSSEKITIPLKTECADSLAMADHFKEASEVYSNILVQFPENHTVLNNYGYFMLLQNENLSLAGKYIQSAVAIEPKNTSYLDSLAWFYYKVGKIEQAKSILERSMPLGSDDPVKLDHLADIYSALDKRDEALQFWSQALRLYPKNFFDILDKLDPEI